VESGSELEGIIEITIAPQRASVAVQLS